MVVKTFFSILVVASILIVGSIYEHTFIKRQFDEFNQVLTVLYEKIDDETATQDDVYAVQKNWLSKKKVLHIFIPHNEIKEIDLWLSESATLVRDKEWKDAISKIEVLIELSEQIPKTFVLSFENIL
ncbi:MAG: DUF4363 family protein [Clostridiales bacterium]|nr:DUF4363 family protein [Clostridiales bacterium]